MNQNKILIDDDKLKSLLNINDYKEFSIAIDLYFDENENKRSEFDRESVAYLYEQIIKKAIESKTPLTNIQWRDVIKTITLLCEKYFPFFPLDECYRLFYRGLLLSSNFNLAKHYIDKFEDSESVSLEVSKHFFNLSQNGKDEYIISAMNCLTIVKSPKKEVISELDFILSIIWLSKYLPDLKPQEVLNEQNRKRFIKQLLDTYPLMYKQLSKIIELGNMMGCCSTSEDRNSLKLLAAETAFENGDFDYCGQIVKNLVSLNYHPCWKLASELAFNERFKDIEYRLIFLSFAMMYCEDDMLKEFLECKKVLQSKLDPKNLSDNYYNPIDDINNDYIKFHIKISSLNNTSYVKVLLENLVDSVKGDKIALIKKIKYFFTLEILTYLKPNDFKDIYDLFFIPPNQLLHYYDTIVESSFDIEEKLDDVKYLKEYLELLKLFNSKSDELMSLKRNLQEGLNKDFESIAKQMKEDLLIDQPFDLSDWIKKFNFGGSKSTHIYKQPIYGEHYDAMLLYLIIQADKVSLFAKIDPIFKEIINLIKYLYDIEIPNYYNDDIRMKNDYEKVKDLFKNSQHDSFIVQREKIVCNLIVSSHLIQAGYALLLLSNHPYVHNISFDTSLSYVHQFLEVSLNNIIQKITPKGNQQKDLLKRNEMISKALEIYNESIQSF